MCGIAGFVSTEPIDPRRLEEMTSLLTHRGPDDFGYFGFSGGASSRWREQRGSVGGLQVGLGFRRLSILDLSPLGAQPMGTSNEQHWIVFNGEIYNYVELKRELPGASFHSGSDTEVLLSLLSTKKMDALPLLNGMFAFAYFDRAAQKLFLARDPFGIKPIYYTRTRTGFYFASELRALLPFLEGAPAIRRDLVARYLRTNWMPDPETLFENIYKLEAGHYLTIDLGLNIQKTKYWDLSYSKIDDEPMDLWKDRLHETLERVMERQLRSDVPIAFFLSGGIDSSLLAVRGLEVQREQPTAFTIGFKWSNNSPEDEDLAAARVLAQRFPFAHREILLEPSVGSLLPDVVRTLEEPIADPAALCSYLICQQAASDFKVLVSGQGGDELFGGYPVFRSALLARRIQSVLGAGGITPALSSITSRLGGAGPFTRRLRRTLDAARYPWPEPFFVLRGAMNEMECLSVLAPGLVKDQRPAFERPWEHAEVARGWDPKNQMLYLDTKTYLPSLNLAYTDKTSMRHSVEVRVPFLDLEIARLVEKVPTDFKFDVGHTKILLKAYAERLLPHPIVHRKKAGFGFPVGNWIRRDLSPLVGDLLSTDRVSRQGLLNPVTVERWRKEHDSGRNDHGLRLYNLLTLQMWIDAFNIKC